jgi:hypothetical protein
MKTVALQAHFDGEQIRLDEPFVLTPQSRLLVIVISERSEEEEEAWREMSKSSLAHAYGDAEPEYHTAMIRERNQDYEGR